MRSRAPGVTLIELLVVLALILMLLGLVGVQVWKARERARADRTLALTKSVSAALEAYNSIHRDYPTGDPAQPPTWPSPYDTRGVEFRTDWLDEEPSGLPPDSIDKANPVFLKDGWGRRIRYRKTSSTEFLVWSVGPDGVDDLGAAARAPRGDDLCHLDTR
ncbi:MAG: hypothetical protein AMXMBFR7_42120 [Planctomycetota bacterium]